MGMAASQARFLSLTARKTNTEYEGQQVNQQRTTLSNQSANYYNQLMGMTVPTPPSTADYTKTTYTFTDGALTNTVTSMIAEANGSYRVNYTSSYQNDSALVSASSSVVTKIDTEGVSTQIYSVPSKYKVALGKDDANATTYTVSVPTTAADGTVTYSDATANVVTGATANALTTAIKASLGIASSDTTTKVLELANADGTYNYSVVPTEDGTIAFYSEQSSTNKYKIGGTTLRALGVATADGDGKYNDTYLDSLKTPAQVESLLEQEQTYAKLLNSKYGDNTWLVRYTYNSTTQVYTPVFYSMQALTSKNMSYDENGNTESNVPAYTIGSEVETTEIKNVESQFEKDSTGRLISITLYPGEDDEVTYSLTTNSATDQAKYKDAMNQYEYNKSEYDQEIQSINAKIETIQAEDKTLELRLKQLDTEQNAISTEMDAVKKVIEKNVESTFKTFG